MLNSNRLKRSIYFIDELVLINSYNYLKFSSLYYIFNYLYNIYYENMVKIYFESITCINVGVIFLNY